MKYQFCNVKCIFFILFIFIVFNYLYFYFILFIFILFIFEGEKLVYFSNFSNLEIFFYSFIF